MTAGTAPPTNPLNPTLPVWRANDGSPLACHEKIKVMNENFRELRQSALDSLEDALLMGNCGAQWRRELHAMIDTLKSDFAD